MLFRWVEVVLCGVFTSAKSRPKLLTPKVLKPVFLFVSKVWASNSS